jgi:2-polyprenyl-3-methyl-5-hydroxy-6-metoxy-1,4-benzoquinol methylase
VYEKLKDQTIDYYNSNAVKYAQSTLHINLNCSYNFFLPYLPPNCTILDAGCGAGRDAKIFKSLGYQVTAMDASIGMVEISSEHIGHPTLHLTFEDIDFESAFDGIWCCASLVHVSPENLPKVFQNIKRALKPNGIWYMSFIAGDSEGLRNGRYYHFLNENTLRRYIEETGDLAVILYTETCSIADKFQAHWIHCVVKKNTFLR